MYNVQELNRRVKALRRGFIIRISVIGILMIAAAVLIAVGFLEVVTFLSIIFEFLMLFLLYRLVGKYKPAVLFSAELVGENIKEDEYVGARKVNYHGRYNPRGVHIRLPRNKTNRSSVNKGNIRSTVYIKLSDGNVTCISDLYKSHTDVYEIGDVLRKYAGTKYPVVESRLPERQPCPICGEINTVNDAACRGCGLEIINE